MTDQQVEKEEIVEAMEASRFVESLDNKIGDEENARCIGENIASKKDEYLDIVNKMTIESLLGTLDERERKVIIYRYYKEMTQSKVAEVYGTSQVQVSRIEKKALEKMKVAMER